MKYLTSVNKINQLSVISNSNITIIWLFINLKNIPVLNKVLWDT